MKSRLGMPGGNYIHNETSSVLTPSPWLGCSLAPHRGNLRSAWTAFRSRHLKQAQESLDDSAKASLDPARHLKLTLYALAGRINVGARATKYADHFEPSAGALGRRCAFGDGLV